MYVVTVTFEIEPGQMEMFLPLMLDNARISQKAEPGCQRFDVCRDDDTVFLYEIYDDASAFQTHLNTPHFLSFDAAVANLVRTKDVRVFDEVYV